jgi:hypothetical protein
MRPQSAAPAARPRVPADSSQQTWREFCLESAIDAVVELLPCLESRDLRIEAARFLSLLVAQRTPAQVRRLEISRGLRG